MGVADSTLAIVVSVVVGVVVVELVSVGGGQVEEVEVESVGIRGLLDRGESKRRLGLRPDTSILQKENTQKSCRYKGRACTKRVGGYLNN